MRLLDGLMHREKIEIIIIQIYFCIHKMRFGGKHIVPLGANLQPYYQIGGNILYRPPLLACVQTDGSRTHFKSRVAMILTTRDLMNTYKKMTEIPHTESSTETEWAAVSAGLEFAIQKGEFAIGIENDNLSVVGALITNKQNLRNEYARYYRERILQYAALTLWTGIRWIPREINRADDLF